MTEPAPVPVPTECPAHSVGENGLVRVYDEAFAADPDVVYAGLRATYGPIAPVEFAPGVAVNLVLGYEAALEVLRSPSRFSRDPRSWQQKQSPNCPVLPMMGYRPNILFADGAAHERYRSAVTSSMQRVNVHDLRAFIDRTARALISRFGASGEADIVRDFAFALSLQMFEFVFGCPPDVAARLSAGIAGIMEMNDPETANAQLGAAVMELVMLKRRQPGHDVPSWMMEHPADLTDEELAHQLTLVMGAGIEPQSNLIANTMRLLLIDDGLADDLTGGSLSVEDALDEVLWTDPPVANYAGNYPYSDTSAQGVRLPAAEPVVISFAAANADPALITDQRTGNRAHIAWGAGLHACPAQNPSRLIALTAIETLLDALPDVRLAVPADELRWRQGPFHRALTALPVRFTPVASPTGPVPTIAPVGEQHTWSPRPTDSTSPAATSTPRTLGSATAAPRRWWSSLVRWWRGR